MSRSRAGLFFLFSLLVIVNESYAHFNVILPAEYTVWQTRKSSKIRMRFMWGHGYEHIWFDAQIPTKLFVVDPDGKKTDLKPKLEEFKIKGARKEARAYGFEFRPESRGDYVFAAQAYLLWDEQEQVFLQDYTKSFLHVQVKKGWDRKVGLKFELVPLTRPYGLQVGGVFQAQVLLDGKPLPNCEVEFEKYQPRTPREAELPGEEFITFEAKTDPNGIITFGLHEKGWFALTAIHGTGNKTTSDGKTGELIERSTLWINIAERTVIQD